MHAKLKEGAEHALLNVDENGEEADFPRGEHKLTRIPTPASYRTGGMPESTQWIVITIGEQRYGRPTGWWARKINDGEIELIRGHRPDKLTLEDGDD